MKKKYIVGCILGAGVLTAIGVWVTVNKVKRGSWVGKIKSMIDSEFDYEPLPYPPEDKEDELKWRRMYA